MRPAAAALIALLASTASVRAAPDDRPDAHAIVQGMTITCPGWGAIWGSDEMVETMRHLETLGCNWVAIHPYAGIRPDGTVSFGRGRYDDPEWLTRPIREAHALGLKIMIKPHIAYWGSPFAWRGEIEFDTDEQWARFFSTYEQWITKVAKVSEDAGADAFVVGTELDRTVRFEKAWRRIIGAVRERTDAPLTYSANWDSYEKVRFWDALDVIGIQSYFPLVRHERLPSERELERGWTNVLARLEEFARPYGKKIVLAELGYNRSSKAAVQPWEYRMGGPDAEETQRRCMNAAMRAVDESDLIVGAFLWKWFPGNRWRGNFQMSSAAMQSVIAEHWGETSKRRNVETSKPE